MSSSLENKITFQKFVKSFKPLNPGVGIPIEQAISQELIKKDTEVMMVRTDPTHQIVFSKYMMGFHHIAQGLLNKIPYLLSFCDVCNSGMVFNPTVKDKLLTFRIKGVYQGVLLMMDNESNSYWDHITGECIAGKYKGSQLDTIHSHQVYKADEVHSQFPNCQFGVSKLNLIQKVQTYVQYQLSAVNGMGLLPPGFKQSMGSIDDRLPEMSLGLGIWKENAESKFYPLSTLKEKEIPIIDSFNEQPIILFISPINDIPVAIQIDPEIGAEFSQNRLCFSNGNFYFSGKMFSSDGVEISFTQPNQVFARWYGFVSRFPDCKVV